MVFFLKKMQQNSAPGTGFSHDDPLVKNCSCQGIPVVENVATLPQLNRFCLAVSLADFVWDACPMTELMKVPYFTWGWQWHSGSQDDAVDQRTAGNRINRTWYPSVCKDALHRWTTILPASVLGTESVAVDRDVRAALFHILELKCLTPEIFDADTYSTVRTDEPMLPALFKYNLKRSFCLLAEASRHAWDN